MAIANSDGSIILSTKVDTSGMEQGTKSLKSQAAKLAAEYRKAGMSQSEAFKKAWTEIERTRKETEKATKSTQTYGEKAKTAFQGVGSALKSLAGYLALAFSVTKIIQFSNEAGQLATQTEASVQRLVDIYGSASDSVGDFIDVNARALGMSKSAAASFSSVYGNLFSVWADQATNAQLTNEYLQMTAVVASKTGRTVEDVQERVRSGLLGNTEAIEDLGIFVNVKTIEMTDAFQRMANGKSWEQLDAYTQQQIRSMAILEQATAKYGDEVANTSATIRNRFNAAYQDFQNSWGNIVNTVLLPVLETLTQIFDIATKGLNALSGRSGQILENVELQEENTDKTAENIEEQTKNQKELNKELKKATASFDDIEILSAKTKENTSGGGLDSGLQGIGGDLGGTAPDGSAYVEEINATLAAIMQTVAISMIAIGLILLFTGNVSWGIGAIIFGLGLEGVTVASITQTDPSPEIINSLLALQGVAVGASVALGIMMIFMGSKGLGVGLIAYGAIQLGVTIYEITQFDASPIESTINAIQGVAAGAMLALGFFLLYFKVNIPLAISLIAGGALLVVDEISDIVEGGVSPEISAWINAIMLILEGAALVIGIILLVTGVNIPLGISLTATGAFALGKEVVVNWNAIVEALRGSIGAITAIVSGALLVLGIILVCTGVGIPLGIGLILAGAAGLATVVAVNWDAIWDAITGAFNAVIDWIKTYGMLALGALLCLTGVGLPFGIALIINWVKESSEQGVPLANVIKQKVEETWNAVKEWVETYGLLVLAVILCLTGVGLPFGIGMLVNWVKEGSENGVPLANVIKEKAEEIFTAVSEWVTSYGMLALAIILCLTGVGIPFGIALIINWAKENYDEVPLATAIVDKVKEVWGAVEAFWDENIAPIFTAAFWLDLAKGCGNGLIQGFENAINGIITMFENMINFVVRGLNKISISLPNWAILGDLAGKKFGVDIPEVNLNRVSFPRLAQGAVIPPNREFLAVLGDQKQGTNIEAPLQTIVDAFNIALAQNGSYNGSSNTEVVLEIDGREFGRAVVEQGNRENRRIGTRLVIA